jgi:hypothetical protein
MLSTRGEKVIQVVQSIEEGADEKQICKEQSVEDNPVVQKKNKFSRHGCRRQILSSNLVPLTHYKAAESLVTLSKQDNILD